MTKSNWVGRGFEHRSCQTKDCIIGICYFSAKHTALSRKSKDWLARNQDNVSKWGDMSIHGLLFQYKNPTNRVVLVQSGPHHHLIENNLFSPCICKIAELALSNNQSLTH
jgi:hypothetical protein